MSEIKTKIHETNLIYYKKEVRCKELWDSQSVDMGGGGWKPRYIPPCLGAGPLPASLSSSNNWSGGCWSVVGTSFRVSGTRRRSGSGQRMDWVRESLLV